MTTQKRVMLLIDADNVAAAVIEQAVGRLMAAHGAVHVRRAYCTAESALTHQKLFKALSIRPIVNLSSGKNANDIALAVDAMDLAISERPDLAVIVSSDSDFAPLVIRLREKGCRVEGIGQIGKTGEDSKAVYDDFVDLSHKRGAASPAHATPAKSGAASPAPAPAPAPAPSPATAAAPRRRRAPAKRAAEPAPAPVTAASAPVPAEPAPEKSQRRRRSRR